MHASARVRSDAIGFRMCAIARIRTLVDTLPSSAIVWVDHLGLGLDIERTRASERARARAHLDRTERVCIRVIVSLFLRGGFSPNVVLPHVITIPSRFISHEVRSV